MNLELPSADTKRWSSRRKAAVVLAVSRGSITRKEAFERYLLTEEELASWEAAFARRGVLGLRGAVREGDRSPRNRIAASPYHEPG